MSDIKDYEKWRELFQEEQKGISPQQMMYRPVPEIEILPYLNHKIYSGVSFLPGYSTVSHSFLVDETSAEWFIRLYKRLKPYEITNIFYIKEELLSKEVLNALNKISPNGMKACERGYKKEAVQLDFGSKTILDNIKRNKTSLKSENRDLWIQPGDDFLWNISLLYGIRKFLADHDGMKLPERCAIHIPFSRWSQAEKPDQLIPLANQILSMMAGGLNQCIWDIRNANQWQKSNLIYLLNTPEIIVREGHIFTHPNPIKGSPFFEELSDKVMYYLREIE